MRKIKSVSATSSIEELELEELVKAWPVVKQLRSQLTLEKFCEITAKMPAYRAFVFQENGTILAYAGFSEQLNLYEGHHLFVYELVVDATKRHRGLGKILLDEVANEGKKQGCEQLVLTSGLEKAAAHQFYEKKMKLTKTSFVFRKAL